MIPLKKQTIGNETINCVEARWVWEQVGSKTRFNDWILRRISEAQAIEGEDYFYSNLGKNPTAGRPSKDYLLTIDLAKEFAMLERNEKGRQVRRHFIECERKLLAQSHQVPQSYAAALLECARLESEREKLAQQAQKNAPLIAHAKAISATDGILIADFAKLLCKKGVSVGQNRLFEWLRNEGYLMRGNKPYQTYVENGYFETTAITISTTHGAKEVTTTRITGKGQLALSQKIINAFRITKLTAKKKRIDDETQAKITKKA